MNIAMETSKLPEIWLRGPVAGIPQILQPIAHALLQAQEEVHELIQDLQSDLLWEKPAGAASVAFHIQHICGVLDRLFTYAKGESLSFDQLKDLKVEGQKPQAGLSKELLIEKLDFQFKKAIQELSTIDQDSLFDPRGVGRAQLPSTTIGLLFHAAEHTMRHVGQLLVTVKVLKEKDQENLSRLK